MRKSLRQLRLPVARAQAVLLFERVSPALFPLFVLLGLGAAAALFGLHELLPWQLHLALVVAGTGAAAALAVRAAGRAALPSREAALVRIESDSGLPAGSLRALEDRPLSGTEDDPFWRAHQDRLRRVAAAARLGGVRAAAERLDRYGLRYGVLLLLVLAVIVAGEHRGERLRSAMLPRIEAGGPVTADIWLDPPAYTGRPPILLVQAGALPQGRQEVLTVPEGTTAVLRLSGPGERPPRARITLFTAAGRERLETEKEAGTMAARLSLDENAALSVRAAGGEAVWPISVLSDTPPDVRLTEDPEEDGSGRLGLSLVTGDDYGIADASLVLRLQDEQDLPPDAPRPESGVMAQKLEVPAPGATGVPGERRISVDLTQNPWAGLDVFLSVRVEDGAGQIAATPEIRTTLPERGFYNPLARVVIEERRKLALAPSSWARTARMLDALTLAPQRFAESGREYLLLRAAYHEVFEDRGENPEGVVDAFWPLAVALEDEGLELARQRLEAAQDALRQALAEGAPPAELEEKIEALRQAMRDYLEALARSGDATVQTAEETMGTRDLDEMLDAMRDAAERGAADEAQDLLAELARMLDDIRIAGAGQPGSSGGGSGGPGGQGQGEGGGEGGNRPLDKAGDLIDRQRRLSDETFSARRGERGREGLTGEQRGLAEGIGDLRGEGGEGAEGALDRAEQAMQGAAEALERGELGAAQALQGNAISSLAEAAEAIAEAEAERRGEGQGEGRAENGRSGRPGGGSPAAGRDPLGRPYGPNAQSGVEIPGLSDPDRIREVIETLRRRVADPSLPEEERLYLEELLERF